MALQQLRTPVGEVHVFSFGFVSEPVNDTGQIMPSYGIPEHDTRSWIGLLMLY